jgi:hypothetical protein
LAKKPRPVEQDQTLRIVRSPRWASDEGATTAADRLGHLQGLAIWLGTVEALPINAKPA